MSFAGRRLGAVTVNEAADLHRRSATRCCRHMTVDGVDWIVYEAERGYVFRTYGRTPAFEVAVPDDYEPEINALVDLRPGA